MPMKRIYISTADDPSPMAPFSLFIETNSLQVQSNEEQWVRDLADYIAANPPPSLGWTNPGMVLDIGIEDTSREVTPNP